MKNIATIILISLIINCQGQIDQKFNLGFELQNETNSLSDGWFKWGSYKLTIDTLTNSGLRSGKITSNDNASFGGIAYKIPANYPGKKIKLKGYMKLKEVGNGYAGLLLRIDGDGEPLAFDNMKSQNVSGTIDWKMYSITLDYPSEAENIIIAGILTGSGEVWFDDFRLSIDGNNIQNLETSNKTIYNASLDREFYNSSKVDSIYLTSEIIDNLALLGKVWGFLKYYHPEIAKGNYNWDYELFRIISDYINELNDIKREEVLLNWINSLGNVGKCITCKPTSEQAKLKPDLEWINSDIILDSLRKQLHHIYSNRNQDDHYYIKMDTEVYTPIFKNENAYTNMPYPDIGFRLLSLYRYWNMINFFFPYRDLTDKKWNATLKEYIPIFINSKNELEYELAVLQLISEVNDSHANLSGGNDKINEWKGNNFVPVHLRFIEDNFVVTDYYNPELKNEVGLEVGDIITNINGKNTDEIVSELNKYYPASNNVSRLRDISADILRSQKDELEVEFIREDEVFSKNIKLYPRSELNIYSWYKENNEKCYMILDNNIGYVTLMSIKDNDIPIIKKKLKDTRGIIIDIRNYPSTFVPFKLGSYFVSTSTPFVKISIGSIKNPGEFTFTKELVIPESKESYKGKLIVLVNQLSQSQAEYTAMAFRAGENTSIIGSTTAGADGEVSSIVLPGGLHTRITGIGVYYPNGEETQRIGIIPDIEVRPTIIGMKNGEDELIEKAIEIILKE